MTKEQTAEIKRLEEAIAKSKSPYLKRDYQKRINRIKGESKRGGRHGNGMQK